MCQTYSSLFYLTTITWEDKYQTYLTLKADHLIDVQSWYCNESTRKTDSDSKVIITSPSVPSSHYSFS